MKGILIWVLLGALCGVAAASVVVPPMLSWYNEAGYLSKGAQAAAMVNLKQMAIFTALLVATVKSTLVLLYFMHLRYENKLYTYMLIAVIATFALFLGLTFADYSFRGS